MIYTDKKKLKLPATNGVIPQLFLDNEKKKFAESILPLIVDMVEVDYEYPTPISQNVILKLKVRLEKEADLSKVINTQKDE